MHVIDLEIIEEASGAVVSTVTSQQKGSWFKPKVYMFSLVWDDLHRVFPPTFRLTG